MKNEENVRKKLMEELVEELDKTLEKNARSMFEQLKKHIGEEVTYSGWLYGVEQKGTAKLKAVDDFESVWIGNIVMPFVGYGAAIASIKSKDGKTLFFNPNVENKYDIRDKEKIYEAKSVIFGRRIVKAQKEEIEKQEKEYNDFIEKSNIQAKEDKYKLMIEGLELIKPETKEEWIKYVDANTNDGYSACVVRAVISMMKKFEEGIPFEEAEKQVYNEEYGLSGFMEGAAARALSYFSKKGREYRLYWNKLYGIEDPEEERVVNPAIINIR